MCGVQLIPRLAYWSDMDVWNVTGSCSDLSDLPDITFVLGADSYTLPPSAWVTEVRLPHLPCVTQARSLLSIHHMGQHRPALCFCQP